MTGWSLIERKGKIGWIPESYLKKTKTDIEEYLGMIGPAEGMQVSFTIWKHHMQLTT